MFAKYTKCLLDIPNGHKIYVPTLFHSKGLQTKYAQVGIFGMQIWQPWHTELNPISLPKKWVCEQSELQIRFSIFTTSTYLDQRFKKDCNTASTGPTKDWRESIFSLFPELCSAVCFGLCKARPKLARFCRMKKMFQ
jgi:hypothetical protein